ncbi:hypothetical protein [Algoriphagus sp. PAP.12]|uniref:hypothetical protein n=1 Tax=Algoriphagus sp. PAP.12 TaxID=2996678 RepID=UPI00227C6F0F|nr:hypothetical protein [Algoriphagus sp. PAP.12]
MDNSLIDSNWSFFRKVRFRFAFIYFILFFPPLDILASVPGIRWLSSSLYSPLNYVAYFLNDYLFHIKDELVPQGGSGDTSFGWALQYSIIVVAISGTVIWTLLDRNKEGYPKLYYILCLVVRYSLASIAFVYGILKVFAMQMYFPNLSQLATPLGDYLPMRLSWMFIGYSPMYQIFSGVAEVLVALLLFWRRTALLGALLSVGVFANVAMLNLSYDIPVKIFSINLFIASLFLVWQERERLFAFFLQNKSAKPSNFYNPEFSQPWFKYIRIGLKSVFIISAFGIATYNYYGYYKSFHSTATKVLDPIEPGYYHVELFVKNGDTIPENLADSLRWRDLVFDYNGAGSFGAVDEDFWMRYGRAYFDYRPDSTSSLLEWRKSKYDSLPFITFEMELEPDGRISLLGLKNQDSLRISLKKLPRHFQLSERQFHWLSESNR